MARDAYARSVSHGWGRADVGEAWSVLSGPASDFRVGVGSSGVSRGSISLEARKQRVIHLPDTHARDLDAVFKVMVPGSGQRTFAYHLLRRQTSGAYIRIGVFVNAGGTLGGTPRGTAVRIRAQTHAGDYLFTDVPTGLTHRRGDSYWVRVLVHGSSPTNVRAKVWKDGTPEPSAWHVDTTSWRGPQSAGSYGVRAIQLDWARPTLWFNDLNVTAKG